MKQIVALLSIVIIVSVVVSVIFQAETKRTTFLKTNNTLNTPNTPNTQATVTEEEPTQSEEPKENVKKEDFCPVLEQYAEMFMEVHQSGGDLSIVYKFIGTLDLDDMSKDLLRKILLHAADFPTFSLEENQKSTIMEFKNHWYFSCMRALTE